MKKKMGQIHHNRIRHNHGFTLIEAMVGFLVLSIGMLGIASLQTISLKAGQTSVYGSVVVMKIEELFESMRANPASLATYLASIGGLGVNGGCIAAPCLGPALANEDIFWWKQNLTAGLPSTAGVTDVTTTMALIPPVLSSKLATVTLTLSWSERGKTTIVPVTKTYTSTTGICVANPC